MDGSTRGGVQISISWPFFVFLKITQLVIDVMTLNTSCTTIWQTLTRTYMLVIKNYDHMTTMSKNMNWMKLTQLLLFIFLL
jgi:hypothetical protein